MKKYIVYFFIIIQILIIIILGKYIVGKSFFRKQTTINPLKKSVLVFNQSDSLKYFYEPKPNTIDNVNNWVPYKGIYTINADSLNERFDYTPEKNPGTYRIIALGDSFTYGMYVDTKDNWPEQLEDKLNAELKCKDISKFEVINLGVGGYDIQYGIERYKTRGQKYNPDLLIWFLKDDDFQEILEIMLPRELEVQKKMKESGEFDKQVKQGNFYPSWEIARDAVIKEIGEFKIFAQQKLFIKEIRNYFKNNLLFITFDFTKSEYRNFLKDFAKKNSKTFVFDKISNLYRIKDATYFSDPHATKKGNNIIMNYVFEYLKKQSIITCN